MADPFDALDRKILARLQRDSSASVESLAEAVGLSRNACWRRARRLEEAGVIRRRVALLDPDAIGLGLSVFVMVKAREHSPDWLESLRRAVSQMPEIVGAFRMTGDLDYLLRVRVADVAGYDRFYKRLIGKVDLADVSASFVMEDIKDTTELPV
ncbi:MAG: Lrp/AsnC family transcriptional regulator [Marinibacterium sp.]